MKDATISTFNYTLTKDKIKESKRKVYSNKHFGTTVYPACLFYKNITRPFPPNRISENEK